MDYFTIDMEVQPYGWEIHLFEPTWTEFIELRKILRMEGDELDKARELEEALIAKLLKPPWTCTDRAGKLLPCDLSGVQQLPRSVASAILVKILQSIEAPSDPKVKTP